VNTQSILTILFGFTIAVVVLMTMFGLICGLYDPRVDNKEIFKILETAFPMIIGAAISYISRKGPGE